MHTLIQYNICLIPKYPADTAATAFTLTVVIYSGTPTEYEGLLVEDNYAMSWFRATEISSTEIQHGIQAIIGRQRRPVRSLCDAETNHCQSRGKQKTHKVCKNT